MWATISKLITPATIGTFVDLAGNAFNGSAPESEETQRQLNKRCGTARHWGKEVAGHKGEIAKNLQRAQSATTAKERAHYEKKADAHRAKLAEAEAQSEAIYLELHRFSDIFSRGTAAL